MTDERLIYALDNAIERRLRLEYGDDQKPEYRLVHSLLIASSLLKNLGFINAGVELNSIASQAGKTLEVLK